MGFAVWNKSPRFRELLRRRWLLLPRLFFVSSLALGSVLLLEFGWLEKVQAISLPPFLFLMISQEKSYELKPCACCATI
jgi:hypothetical protein